MSDPSAQLDRHFQGYARVELSNIDIDCERDMTEENVRRLLDIFKLEGCRRDIPTNAISALVETGVMHEQTTQNLEPLHTHTLPTELRTFKGRVLCFHGKHRVVAARRFLSAKDDWWPVKVYDSGNDSHGEIIGT